MKRITLKFCLNPTFEKSLKEREGEIKNIEEIFRKFNFRSGRLS